MAKSMKMHDKSGSITPSTALLNQKLATSNAPRTLTPAEIELLRLSKQEIAEWVQTHSQDK